MKKIISLFQRNYDGDRLVRNEVVPGAEWVMAGEGVATRKWDGTCCKIEHGQLWKRYDAKQGKTPPDGFVAAQDDPDPETGHWPGWLLVRNEPNDQWLREAYIYRNGQAMESYGGSLPDGTYECVGPKVQGNPEKFGRHDLKLHGGWIIGDHLAANPQKWDDCPRTFDGIRDYLSRHDIEGIVWHHPDGRMVKIKARDFGIKRTPTRERDEE